MTERKAITIGFKETDVQGRWTILVDGLPRYLGTTFSRPEIGDRLAWLARSCDITLDPASPLLVAIPSATTNAADRAERPRRGEYNIMARKSPKNTEATSTNNVENGKATKTKQASLADMIAAGTIAVGQKIETHYRGRDFTGTILEGGKVRVGRTTYPSLSKAARAVAAEAGNPTASLNGFTFFGTKNAEGKVVPIASLR